MTLFDKAQPFFVLISVVIGLVLGQVVWLRELAPIMITPLLALMLYATFIPIPLHHLGQGLGKYQVVLASLTTNFIWTPLLAWSLGFVFIQNHPDLWVGLIMLMVTPCTDWYVIFTGIAKGDVALATALLPVNLILQILLLPVYLLLFAGQLVELNPIRLLDAVFWVLVAPLLMATISRQLIRRWQSKVWLKKISSIITVFQIICLNLAVVAIFVSQGEIIAQNIDLFFLLFCPLIIFFVTNFILAHQISRNLSFSYPEFACLSCTTLARNSPLSLGIAATAFSEQPLISLTLVIGSLIELPIMVLVSQILLTITKQGKWTYFEFDSNKLK